MIRVLGDRVLVVLPPKPHDQEETTGYTYQTTGMSGSIILAKPSDQYNVELQTRGMVLQLGDKHGQVDVDDVRSKVHTWFVENWPVSAYVDSRVLQDGVDRILTKLEPADFEVQVGDCVLFPPTAGEAVHADGVDYVILNEGDILGVVEKELDTCVLVDLQDVRNRVHTLLLDMEESDELYTQHEIRERIDTILMSVVERTADASLR